MKEKKSSNPAAQNNTDRSFDFLRGLTDEELDGLLDDATEEEDPDTIDGALISAIMDEFESRGPHDPFFDEMDEEEALARFRQRLAAEGPAESPSDKEKRNAGSGIKKFVPIAASVALIIALSFGYAVTSSADGYQFWDKLVNWTKETFRIGDTELPEVEEKGFNPWEDVLPLFAELDSVLRENQMPAKLPTWAPEGCSQKEIIADVNGLTKTISAWFQVGGREFLIQVKTIIYGDVPLQSEFEENRGKNTVYKASDVEHYLTLNGDHDRCNAVWQDGNVQVQMQGDLSEEEVKRMIDSIYER